MSRDAEVLSSVESLLKRESIAFRPMKDARRRRVLQLLRDPGMEPPLPHDCYMTVSDGQVELWTSWDITEQLSEREVREYCRLITNHMGTVQVSAAGNRLWVQAHASLAGDFRRTVVGGALGFQMACLLVGVGFIALSGGASASEAMAMLVHMQKFKGR